LRKIVNAAKKAMKKRRSDPKALSIQRHTSAQIVPRMRERRTLLSIRDKARHTVALRGSPKEESFPVPQGKK